MHTIKSVEMTPARFDSVSQALAFYRYCNPARAIRLNLLEADSRGGKQPDHFSGEHSADIFASVVGAMQRVKKSYTRSVERYFFYGYFELRLDFDDLRKELMLSSKVANRLRNRMYEELEKELVYRELMEFRD